MTAPRWIAEALYEAIGQPGRWESLRAAVAKQLVERLPLEAMTIAIRARIAGVGGITGDWISAIAGLAAAGAMLALTDGDPEVVQLTELYQGACRVLDEAGVPQAVDERRDDTGLSGPPRTGRHQLDLAARIRWLVQQRPTRLELQRVEAERDVARAALRQTTTKHDAIKVALDHQAAMADRLVAERDSARAQFHELNTSLGRAEVARLAGERDQIQALFEEERVSALAASDSDAARIAELEAELRSWRGGRVADDAVDRGRVIAERMAALRTLLGHEVERADRLGRKASKAAADLERERRAHRLGQEHFAAAILRLTEERDAERRAAETRDKTDEALLAEERGRGKLLDLRRRLDMLWDAEEQAAEDQRTAPEVP
jgi:hypothetical protein